MRAWLFVGWVCAVSAMGCASANGQGGGGDAAPNDDASSTDDGGGDDGGTSDAGADSGPTDKLTWTYIYATYFAKATPGHCGNAGCHGTPQAGFLCSSKGTCYTGLTIINGNVGGKMVDPQSPSASVLLDPNSSPVFWFSSVGGNMPQDALLANDTAKSEITAWIMAGALNN